MVYNHVLPIDLHHSFVTATAVYLLELLCCRSPRQRKLEKKQNSKLVLSPSLESLLAQKSTRMTRRVLAVSLAIDAPLLRLLVYTAELHAVFIVVRCNHAESCGFWAMVHLSNCFRARLGFRHPDPSSIQLLVMQCIFRKFINGKVVHRHH
eukprot:381506-Amphidinium_carterae.1